MHPSAATCWRTSRRRALAPGMAVSVYLRREPDGLRVVGIDREWPGRSLVDPRVVVRPVRNRYVELDADRQRLFDTYARAMNVRLGENLSPDERFRALSLSRADDVRRDHARAAALDADRRCRQAARQGARPRGGSRSHRRRAGRTEQRSAVPDLRDAAAERERHSGPIARVRPEPARTRSTTRGTRTSYRLGSGAPSVQFSVAEDGLSADIDVDYRASKAPRSLFNGHLTSSNSDVRSGDNARRHERRWNGFANWWSDVFGAREVRRSR